MSRVARSVRVGLAILFLHVALSIFYWLPEPRPRTFLAPSWDLVAIVGVLVVWAAARDLWLRDAGLLGRLRTRLGMSSRVRSKSAPAAAAPARLLRFGDSGFAFVVVALATTLVLLGFAQGFARREFGYDLVLTLHVPYIPELFQMMYDHEPLGMFVAYLALLLVGLAASVIGIYAAVRAVRRHAGERRGRHVLAGFMVAYIAVLAPLAGVNSPVAAEAYHQARLALNLETRLDYTARVMDVEAAKKRPPNPFKHLDEPPSLYSFVVESYGAVVFSNDEMASEAVPYVANRGEVLEAAGYAVRSGYLAAPVFGGSSWMANNSLLCGVWIDSQERFESSFEMAQPCLPEILNDAGYRTVNAAANTTFQEERNERKFPFDVYYFKEDFEYRGRRYGWSFVPDQFVIQFVDRREVRQGASAPLFVHYQLTSSHHPWNEIPPYIEDWESITDGANVFQQKGALYSNRFVRGSDYTRGYWASVEYSMRAVTDYVAALADEDALIIILGDHQPRSPVAEMHEDSWWAPVHVASRNSRLVDAFAEVGFVRGMTPPSVDEVLAAGGPPRFDDYLGILFDVFKRAAR